VVFAYTLQCASDVSPATFKLLLLEDGRKYIVRGRTWTNPLVTAGRLPAGTPEPAWPSWPAPFRSRAPSMYDDWVTLG
jgi:hypothetical protein